MTTVTDSLALGSLSDEQLVECLSAGAVDPEAFGAELARREQAEQRRASARDAARRRNAEWEAAAYAQYLEADKYARGNLLSDAGKRAKRDAWPMCWQGSDETARGLASDELITFWDYVSPRVPGPGQYAATKRAAAAEQAARNAPAPAPAESAAAIAAEAAAMGTPAPVAAPRPAGAMARYIVALRAVRQAAEATTRALESYPKSSVRGTK